MEHRIRAVALAFVAFLAVMGLGRVAEAEDNTIRQPGDHPNYYVEIEPHLDFAWFDYAGYGINDVGIGLGLRATIPIVKNGFIPTINNTVGIGFGFDYMYFGCAEAGLSCGVSALYFPVVLQWNFYVAQRFSVFGEPGFSLNYAFYSQDACGGGCKGAIPNDFFPGFVFEVGGRYHINEHLALTGRIGFPNITFGVSFM
jgi:hypothetical protein